MWRAEIGQGKERKRKKKKNADLFKQLQPFVVVEKEGRQRPRTRLGTELFLDHVAQVELDGGSADVDDVAGGAGLGFGGRPRGGRHGPGGELLAVVDGADGGIGTGHGLGRGRHSGLTWELKMCGRYGGCWDGGSLDVGGVAG